VSWNSYKLGDVCEIARGGSPRPIDKYLTDDDDGVNWIKIGDATRSKKYIFETKEKIKREGISRSRVVKDGDFLLSNSMSFGRPYILRTTGCIHDGWLVLSNYQDKLDIDFFYYLLSSPIVVNQFELLAQGSTVRNLNKELVTRVEVNIPSLSTQKKIVAKLDAIFAEIDKATAAAEANAKNAEALFQRYLNQVFESGSSGWGERKLSDISRYMGRGKSKHRPRNDESLYGGKYPFIQTGDVRNAKKYITKFTQTYNEKGLAQSKLWEANTVCITIAANIAEIGVLTFEACFPDSVIGINVDDEKVSVDFLYLMLLYQQQLIKSKGKGSAQENINLSTFEDMYFKVPARSEQDEFVKIFNKFQELTDSITNSQTKKINSLEILKQSILKQAFSGELVKE
jgi:type I restriction enzyme S subunit